MKSIVILISGRGSNLEAILQAKKTMNLPVEIRAVIANRADAAGLSIAAAHHVPQRVIDHKNFASRDEFDDALADVIDEYQPDLIVLAGFMRVLGADFITRFSNRIVNIHPSLLPAFPGLHTHRQALATGVKIHGATVHIVTAELDSGPIICQAAVPVFADDTEPKLAARVLAQEHIIYPQAIAWLAADMALRDVARPQTHSQNVGHLGAPNVDDGTHEDFLRSPRIK